MKKNGLHAFMLALLLTTVVAPVAAQIMPPVVYALQVYPTQPSATDSVFVSLTYTSSDGCPDYYLVKDSVGSDFILVSTKKYDQSNRICTQVYSKFLTKINLGLLSRATKIYVDGSLIQTIHPTPDCVMNKSGVVVQGIDGCTGKWLVKDLSPVYSYPRMYLFNNDGKLKAGTKIIFGAVDYPKDSLRSILCPIYGTVKCFFPAEPVLSDTLAGYAYAGDTLVKKGMAVLFQYGYKRALKAQPLQDGRFEFPNLPPTSYTVYILPDRVQHPNYLPTFYINKLAYRNADYYSLKDGRNEIAVNVRTFMKRTGKGRIYGNIFFEAANLKDSILNYYGDKTCLYTTDNSTAVNIPVILYNQAGTPIAWTLSDDKGDYLFENIALDSYRLVSETAETMAESTVNLTQTNAEVGADMILKTQSVVDRVETASTPAFSLYPNPVRDKLVVQSTGMETMRLYNSLGQLMMVRVLQAGRNELNMGNLKSGVYVVKMGTQTQKLIRE